MKINNFLTNILHRARLGLIISNREPQVWQKYDRQGNQYWQVYDVNTNKSHTFGSEQDVRAWLENRYHCL